MHPVDTIAGLRNETGKYKYVYVTGYHIKGDGAFGSNIFVWDENSTETDNGGTIIECATVTTGRYKLKYSGAVNVKWFGAKGDGVADDAVAIQRALNITGAILFDRNKIYKISQQLRISSNTALDLNLSKIRRDFNTSPTGAGLMGFVSNGVHNIIIKNGILDVNGANYSAAPANAFGGATGSNITIQNVTFLDVVDYHAIDLADVKNVVIDNCKFFGQVQTYVPNDKEAIQLDPGYSLAAGYGVIDNFVVSNCIFGENTESGAPAYSAGVGNHSLNIDGGAVTNVKITGCIFKGMTYTAIRCYAFDNTLIANNTFKDCKQDIILNVGTGTSTLGCNNTTIVNNIFDSTLTYLSSGSVRLAGDSNIITNTTINNNTFNVNGVVLRADLANGIIFSNNYIKGASNACNLLNIKDVVISDNIMIDCTNTNIFLTEECKNIKISGNLSKKSLARFLHCTGTGAENRKNITVVNNTQIDGARTFCAFDSGGTSRVTVANNTISTGDDNIIPSDPLIINLGITGLSNYMSNNNISKDIMETPGKTWMATDGGIATNEKVYGSPEGVVIAGVGSIVTRTNGSIGTTLYIKESGTGNTGWVAK